MKLLVSNDTVHVGLLKQSLTVNDVAIPLHGEMDNGRGTFMLNSECHGTLLLARELGEVLKIELPYHGVVIENDSTGNVQIKVSRLTRLLLFHRQLGIFDGS